MKLTRERIVDAGLAVLADAGLPGVSMRAVAARLDAQAGSLYYHVTDKDHLVRLMADRVAQQAYDAGSAFLPSTTTWQAALTAQATTLRATIRRHAGGAVLLASAPSLASHGALRLMERLLATLAEAGVPARHRAVSADVVMSYVTGYVLQEQNAEPSPRVPDADGLATLAADFPMTFESMAAGPSDDDAFEGGLRLLCAGIAARLDVREVADR